MFKRFGKSSKILSLMLALIMVFGLTSTVFAANQGDGVLDIWAVNGDIHAEMNAVEVGDVTRYTGYIEFPQGSTQDLSQVEIKTTFLKKYNLEVNGIDYQENMPVDFSKGYVDFILKNKNGTEFRTYQVNAGIKGTHVKLEVFFNVTNAEKWLKDASQDHKDYKKVKNALEGFYKSDYIEITANIGQSAMKALEKAAGELDLELDGANQGYIREINRKDYSGLRERDITSQSGWMYKMNDKMANMGASQYIISNNDKSMEWGFTLNWGQDLGGAPW
ncbi:DUF4430 domain-containing protein [Tissierella praeacuta]|uniref:DUF4430 domain-containing protein n=1 Tax=Tissierella praeacuta TaxID=43131 RepID=UPI0028B03552|nr:DUF4430 domain-containing protein [Tissierella praeacuta]